MKLFDDFFTITEDNMKFFRYLAQHPKFYISELCEKFEVKETHLSVLLNVWKEQGYILKERLPPKLGGKRYCYSLSKKALDVLKRIKGLLSELKE